MTRGFSLQIANVTEKAVSIHFKTKTQFDIVGTTIDSQGKPQAMCLFLQLLGRYTCIHKHFYPTFQQLNACFLSSQ